MAPLLAGLLAGATAAAAQPSADPAADPIADPAAVVLCDAGARMTLLSPLLVRVELGAFEDRASLAFVNRRLPVPAHRVQNASGWCNVTLEASGMVVSYRQDAAGRGGGSAAAAHELQVHARDGSLFWHAAPDAELPSRNLGGTVYDLKGQNGSLCGKEMSTQGICAPGSHIDLTCGGVTKTLGDGASYCTQGVLAEGGAVVYDDSLNTVVESAEAGGWWASRWGSEAQDLYLFLHGADHKAGLRSLASVSGRSAVPPRRFFGVWWSRWNKYTTQELRDMAAAYEANALPL